jgi:hypothetical protein
MSNDVIPEVTEPVEYRIHEDSLPWLAKKFEKMSKIAREVGAVPPTYKIVREEFKEDKKFDEALGQWVSDGFHKEYVVTVDGEAPKLAGWSFIATITWTKDGNLINHVPGTEESVPEHFRTDPPYCDYCKLSRKRVDSFIVRNDNTGEYKQVGRNCLAKFLGYSNPERVAQYATWLADLGSDINEQEEKLSSGGGHSDYRDLVEFLTMVVAVTERDGWVTQAAAQSNPNLRPSIIEVEHQLDRHVDWHKYPNIGRKITPTDEQRDRALAALAFVRSDAFKTDNDYKHNLKISTASDMFHRKASGVVASLINFHGRDQEWERTRRIQREEAEKRKAEMTKSDFVGEVGERITVPVTVVRTREVGGQFGVSYMYRMLDADGDIYVWFSSNNVLDDGKTYNLTGTVKKHETYNDIKQTVLTRCKADEIESVVVDDSSASAQRPRVKYVVGGKLKSKVRTVSTAGLGEVR